MVVTMENLIQVNELVRKSGKSNAEGLKIPLQTKLNVDYFHAMTKNSLHANIVKYLRFGWPLGHDGKKIPPEPKRNH